MDAILGVKEDVLVIIAMIATPLSRIHPQITSVHSTVPQLKP